MNEPFVEFHFRRHAKAVFDPNKFLFVSLEEIFGVAKIT